MSLLPAIIDQLVASSTNLKAGGSTGPEIPLWAGQFPEETEDTAAALYESGGAPPYMSLSSTTPVTRRPQLQVIARSATYPVANALANQIYGILYGASWASTSAGTFLSLTPNQDPIDMGTDDEDRHMFSTNYSIQIQP